MRIGLYLDMRNPPQWRRPWARHYARGLELVEEADRLGVDSVWLSEHHFFEDGYLSQPLGFAAAIAARTSRARIGTAVLLPALQPAAQLAEAAAIVDVLSDGRLDLGVGVGYRRPEFDAFGADAARRYELVETRVREVRDLWAAGRVVPAPIQDPLPWWGGFFGPRGARMAGRLGMGLLAALPELVPSYLAGLEEGGHPASAARYAQPWNIVLADDPEAAWPRIAPHLAYSWDSYGRYQVEGTGAPPPPPVDPEQMRAPGSGMGGSGAFFMVLTPGDAAAFLRGVVAEIPLEETFFWASIAGMPEDLEDRHVELVCRELRPLVADLRAD
jgi:alkanesulfonate monooxygenase SsuD/methylene tetrahydromethanopterin reductase-like flavin-dependent oxidoreductase (luciferase family)